MKFLIASDIHGSAYYCQKLKERYLASGAKKLILLGDLLYHGARNALPRDYSTLKTAEILNSIKDDLLCVEGNCDSQVDTLVLEFPIGASYLLLPIGDRLMVLTHGHGMPFVPKQGDILVNGHFHVPAFEQRENYIYVNCGSVSIPKEDSPHSYLELDGNMLIWRDVETGAEFMRHSV